MRRFLIWLVFNVRLGPLAPYLLGLALGRRPRRADPGVMDAGRWRCAKCDGADVPLHSPRCPWRRYTDGRPA